MGPCSLTPRPTGQTWYPPAKSSTHAKSKKIKHFPWGKIFDFFLCTTLDLVQICTMKKYEKYATVVIKLFQKKDSDYVFLKDEINDAIICSKHINYIKQVGLEFNVPYVAELGFYTNKAGYRDADFLKGKIYTHNQLQSVPSPDVKKKTSGNKPAWMK